MKYWMALLLALASFSASAGLTKWTDSEGRVHYSDAPPANVKSQSVRTAPGPGTPEPAMSGVPGVSGVAGPKTIYEMESDLKKERKAKEEAAQKAAKEQEQAAQKQQACEQARSQLQTLQNAGRIVEYNDKGERTVVDDAARQQRISDAQAAVGQYCQ